MGQSCDREALPGSILPGETKRPPPSGIQRHISVQVRRLCSHNRWILGMECTIVTCATSRNVSPHPLAMSLRYDVGIDRSSDVPRLCEVDAAEAPVLVGVLVSACAVEITLRGKTMKSRGHCLVHKWQQQNATGRRMLRTCATRKARFDSYRNLLWCVLWFVALLATEWNAENQCPARGTERQTFAGHRAPAVTPAP